MTARRKNPYARPDARTRSAKASGYPARSVFKLKEIDERRHLFEPGQRVLDLGAAPGSWSLYASQRIQKSGRLLAVDRTPIDESFPEHVTVRKADALSLETDELGLYAPYDVVLSDMAPSTSGSKTSDQAKSFELFSRALAIAERLGGPGSSFVGKLLMGPDFEAARSGVRAAYRKVYVIRPKGTRPNSSELFLLGLDKLQPGEQR